MADPEAWDIETHYLDDFQKPTFLERIRIPSNMAKRESIVIGFLDSSKGSLWRAIYNSMNTRGQQYWAYAHHFSVQNSPPRGFDPRFYYFNEEVALSAASSRMSWRKQMIKRI